MSKAMTFDVYGRRLTVESKGDGWRVWQQGADGKRRPAVDLPIPALLDAEEIESYLADLCHEWASKRHPAVHRIT